MKFSFCLFFLFLNISSFSQKKEFESFDVLYERTKKSFFSKPKECLEDAFKMKARARNDKEKVVADQFIGYIYDLTGNVDSARYYTTKRLLHTKKYYFKTDIYYQTVIDYSNWGMDYVDKNILTDELTFALSDIDDQKFKREKGLMFLLLGDVFRKSNEIDKAERYYDKSYLLMSGKYTDADHFLRKGYIEIYRINYLKAKEYLILGLKSFKERDIFTYPLYLRELGYVSLKLGNLGEAKQYLYESIHYQDKYGFNGISSETYLYLAYLEKLQKNKVLELHYLEKSLKFNQGDVKLLSEIYLAFKDFYSRNNNSDKENEFYQKFKSINDSLLEKEKNNIVADLEMRYALTETKKELLLKENIIVKEKKIKTQITIGIFVLGLMTLLSIFLYFKKLKTQKKLVENQKLLHEEQLKLMLENQRTEIIKEKIKSKLEERGRLSQELHDGIASDITALKMEIDSDKNLEKQEIDKLIVKIDNLYNEIRNLAHNLDPDNISDIDFSKFVDNLSTVLEKSGLKINKRIYISNRIDDLEVKVLVNLYRIFQEISTNILKHSKASEVIFEVIEDEKMLKIQIQDNGVGFDISQSKYGIGLKNIKNRVDSFQGKIQINSTAGFGTEIMIDIPILD
jgi:signal transduction histidine kinase